MSFSIVAYNVYWLQFKFDFYFFFHFLPHAIEMAKTRSQAKQERSKMVPKPSLKKVSKKINKTKSKSKEIKVPNEFNCRIQLTRLSQSQINLWLHGQPVQALKKKIRTSKT